MRVTVLIVALACLMASCVWTKPIRAGEGSTSDVSRARQANQKRAGFYLAAQSTCSYADKHPDDIRANRKAIALAEEAIRRSEVESKKGEEIPSAATIYGWTEGARRNLAQTTVRCVTNLEVAALEERLNHHDVAAKLLIESVRTCAYVPALSEAAYVLKGLKRCDELVGLAEEIWPVTRADEQIRLLDAVNRCSTDLNFRKNMSFAGQQVVEDYVFHLKKRAQKQRRGDCLSSCSSAWSACQNDCRYGGCGCQERYNHCTAICEAS